MSVPDGALLLDCLPTGVIAIAEGRIREPVRDTQLTTVSTPGR